MSNEITVTLPIWRYNKLLEIEQGIIKNEKVIAFYGQYFESTQVCFLTENKAIIEAKRANDLLKEKFDRFIKENPTPEKNLFRKMSIWGFVKWRYF